MQKLLLDIRMSGSAQHIPQPNDLYTHRWFWKKQTSQKNTPFSDRILHEIPRNYKREFLPLSPSLPLLYRGSRIKEKLQPHIKEALIHEKLKTKKLLNN